LGRLPDLGVWRGNNWKKFFGNNMKKDSLNAKIYPCFLLNLWRRTAIAGTKGGTMVCIKLRIAGMLP